MMEFKIGNLCMKPSQKIWIQLCTNGSDSGGAMVCQFQVQLLQQKRNSFIGIACKRTCDFRSGRLKHFKKKHSIRYLKVSGEKLSADKETADEFIDNFVQKISDKNLSPEQIFNMHEMGLFWRCHPKKTFATSDETAPFGVKDAKERITVLLCYNAAGTLKCKPLVVGKST